MKIKKILSYLHSFVTVSARNSAKNDLRVRRHYSLESLESRQLLTTATFADGLLSFESEAGRSDQIEVSAFAPETLRIEVSNGDSINLGDGVLGDPNFVLSNGNATLDVNVGTGGVTLNSTSFRLGDMDDQIIFDSSTEGVEFWVHGGENNDTVDASLISNVVTLIGGNGNDTLFGGGGNDTIFGGNGNDEINGFGGDDHLVGDGQVDVTITNLQQADGAILTPAFLATTDGMYDFFDVGNSASENLERLAEDGITSDRIAAALNSGGVSEAMSTSGGIITPGDSRTVSFLADSQDPSAQYLSFASMVIPSNDAFIGNDDPQLLDLFDANGTLIPRAGNNAFVISGAQVWDAGTEVNDEIVENTAGLGQMAPNTGVDENGVITLHQGLMGSANLGGSVGNILTARPNADFTLPGANIASIEITANDGNDVIFGGSGNDTILGGDGNDILVGGDNNDHIFGGAGDDILEGGGQVEITITNLQTTDGGLLTPVFLATTNGVYDFFDVGSAASTSLERLAEDGNVGPRIEAAINSGGVFEAVGTQSGPLGPGETRSVILNATSTNELTQYLSFASMFIPSNDAFIGNDDPTQIDLFNAFGELIERTGDSAIIITGDQVYDAGTEVNDEIPENTAALNQSAPNTGVDENGVIRQHEGFQGSSRFGGALGNILTARPNADFTAAGANVMQIEIRSNDGDDYLNGGDGSDTINGGMGMDKSENNFIDSRARVLVSEVEQTLQIDDLFTSRDVLQNVEVVDLNSGDRNDRFVVRPVADSGLEELNIHAGNGQNIVNAGTADIPLNIVTGNGNDRVRAGSANDTVATNGGSDHVFGNGGDDTIDAGGGRNRIFGNSGDDMIIGGNDRDEIFGGSGDDTIDAGNGRNRILGGRGNDQIVAGTGGDAILAGAGNDVVFAGAGNDLIFGAAGNDIILGQDGRDRIFGGSGRDLLVGGLSRDSIFAGSNDDILISGNTSLNQTELQSILEVWTSNDSYLDRATEITDPNNSIGGVLEESTITADTERNTLLGQSGRDLFFASLIDNVFSANEEDVIRV